MKSRLYVETTIPSYLTSWPSRDVVIAGRQQITKEWWESRRSAFQLHLSQLVIDEVSAGISRCSISFPKLLNWLTAFWQLERFLLTQPQTPRTLLLRPFTEWIDVSAILTASKKRQRRSTRKVVLVVPKVLGVPKKERGT